VALDKLDLIYDAVTKTRADLAVHVKDEGEKFQAMATDISSLKTEVALTKAGFEAEINEKAKKQRTINTVLAAFVAVFGTWLTNFFGARG